MSITSKINDNKTKLDNINEGLTKVDSVIHPLEEININQNIDTSNVNVIANDVVNGKKFIDYNGSLKTGTHVCQARPKLSSVSVTPNDRTQYIRPGTGYDGLNEVIVFPVPNNYVKPSGNLDISQNGLYHIATYDCVTVNVANSSNVNISYDVATKTLTIKE